MLLVHGFAVNLDLSWLGPGVVDALATRYTVITLDLRGHGASDKPHESTAYGIALVEDLVRLLDHLGVRRTQVVGYSMGGVVALKLMTSYPDRVTSAVLGGAGWRPADLGPPDRVERWQKALELVARGEATIAEMLAGPGAPALTPAVREALNRDDPAALAVCLQGYRALFTVTESQLRANTIPTLAIVGESDREARPNVDRMAGVMQNLQVTIIPGAGHLTTVGHPLFLQQIRRFLNSHDGR